MKKLTTLFFIIALMISSAGVAQTHQISSDNAEIKWTASKIGGSHNGHILLKEGSLTWEEDQLTSGKFVIDMSSITNDDIENDTYRNNLIEHLKSNDFFGAEEFPEAILEFTEVSGFVDEVAQVKGELTIRGITHPVEFSITHLEHGLSAIITIDRSDFDVKFRSKSFFKNLGDKLIHDEFKLEITLSM